MASDYIKAVKELSRKRSQEVITRFWKKPGPVFMQKMDD